MVVGINPDDNTVYVSIVGDEAMMFGMNPQDADVFGDALKNAAKRAKTT